ncbi:hypothetical protein PROFUN_02511 [Planoprotostelium fungivorum]|uniref:Uncharacterized protein n=1 Tax=Planoprotostelium fungivorum TaxID=1890364 RepID=A0A2P6MP93_9EUKA|nr:hypothetical protein PROFUN_02511 [Planoprotostelium fungivorum]
MIKHLCKICAKNLDSPNLVRLKSSNENIPYERANRSDNVNYTNSCICGVRFDNNCAHFLSNWMMRTGRLATVLRGTALQIRSTHSSEGDARHLHEHGLRMSHQAPTNDSFIYCERNSDHQGHVYYGKKGKCVFGTGDGSFGADYYEYYE